jgi:hypothetical protein
MYPYKKNNMDNKKTQRVVVIILVVTALLGIVGAFLVYYLSTQDDAGKDVSREQKEYCACIKAYTTPDCNDCSCTQIESQALESKIGEKVDGKCTLDCAVPEGDEEEEPQQIIECLIPQVKESNCHSVSVRDADTRSLIKPPIPTETPVLITANFVPRVIGGQEEEFTKYIFIVNGVTTEVDTSEVPSTMINEQKTFMPEIEFSDFQDIDTLTVQSVAYSDRDPDGDSSSKYCYRQYDLTQTRGTLCSSLIVDTQEGSAPYATIVDRLELNIPNLEEGVEISIDFDFDHEDLGSVKTRVIPSNLLEEILVGETIFLEYEHLYSTPELFVDGEGFPIFDNNVLNTDRVLISAQLRIDNTPVDSAMCTESIQLTTISEAEPEEEEPDSTIEADIQLLMEGPSCVRKAEDENSTSRTNYRITVVNNTEDAEEIRSITNKLPLGFKYVEGTTTINGTPAEDSILDLTAVGESQELIWSDDWLIQPESSLILEYGINVTTNAIDGENQNEAVVSPVNTPEDMDRLRAEVVTLVSDECVHEEELPETGNLTFISFFTGIIALIFGVLVYQGKIDIIDRTMLKLINTKAIKRRLMSTQEYFEDSILEDEDKD